MSEYEVFYEFFLFIDFFYFFKYTILYILIYTDFKNYHIIMIYNVLASIYKKKRSYKAIVVLYVYYIYLKFNIILFKSRNKYKEYNIILYNYFMVLRKYYVKSMQY